MNKAEGVDMTTDMKINFCQYLYVLVGSYNFSYKTLLSKSVLVYALQSLENVLNLARFRLFVLKLLLLWSKSIYFIFE